MYPQYNNNMIIKKYLTTEKRSFSTHCSRAGGMAQTIQQTESPEFNSQY
jgi:hypothetical protein